MLFLIYTKEVSIWMHWGVFICLVWVWKLQRRGNFYSRELSLYLRQCVKAFFISVLSVSLHCSIHRNCGKDPCINLCRQIWFSASQFHTFTHQAMEWPEKSNGLLCEGVAVKYGRMESLRQHYPVALMSRARLRQCRWCKTRLRKIFHVLQPE